jgi:Fibronectin type III domain
VYNNSQNVIWAFSRHNKLFITFMFIEMDHFPMRNFVITCLTLFILLVLSPLDSSAQIKLAWDPPPADSNVTGYKMYYGTASRTYKGPINVGYVTTYTVQRLSQGVTYYFAVTAYNQFGESGYSDEVSGMIIETVSTPNVLSGPSSGITKKFYTYKTGGSTSNLGHRVQYQFDWNGDGSTNLSTWGSATRRKRWTEAGTYNVRARARSATNKNAVSNWVGPFPMTID